MKPKRKFFNLLIFYNNNIYSHENIDKLFLIFSEKQIQIVSILTCVRHLPASSRDMTVHSEHSLEHELLSDCEQANEEVILLHVRRLAGERVGLHRLSVNTQITGDTNLSMRHIHYGKPET